MGQNDRAANLLVSVTGVNAQTDGNFHRLVELSLAGADDQLRGLIGIVLVQVVNQLHAVLILLAMLHFNIPPMWY